MVVWPGLLRYRDDVDERVTIDIALSGAEVFRGSPRQSDLMIIAGRVSNKMAPVIRHLYQQIRSRNVGDLDGACATSTGVFNNYALVRSTRPFPWTCTSRLPPASRAAHPRSDAVAEKNSGSTGTTMQVLNLAEGQLASCSAGTGSRWIPSYLKREPLPDLRQSCFRRFLACFDHFEDRS